MGKASISIAVSGSYNGAALSKADKQLASFARTIATAEYKADSAGKGLVDAGNKIAQVGGNVTNLGSRIESLGNKVMPVSGAILGVGVATGKAAITIDTALTGVRKTVDGTEEQYQDLKEAAIEFSKTNAVSADQILDIQALGAQLGFTIDELDEFSQVVSGLDIATDMDAETAATEMAQFANITKMAHGEVSNYGSAIVNLGNHMATTESQISSMAQRVAAASTQVGMSQADILGWSAAMSSLGVEAEAGGTAFSQTVATIDAAVATGSDDIQAFADIAGMSADEFSSSWKASATDTMVALLQGTNSAENMTVALESMGVTGIRQTDVLKRLAGNTELVTQALQYSNDGWRENTALTAEVENRNASMAAQLEIAQNKVTAIAEDVGGPLVGALNDAIDAAQPVIDTVEGASTAFSNADEGTQRWIIGIGAAGAAAGPFLTVTGKLYKTIGGGVTTVGNAVKNVGVYADALTTTNLASLKAYEGNEKLAGALAKNPAAKAAGGVKQYISVMETAYVDAYNLSVAEDKLSNEISKGAKANQAKVQSLQQARAAAERTATTSAAVAAGYQKQAVAAQTSTAATKAHAAAMVAGTAAANALKMAVATIAPMAIIAGVTAVATAIMDASQKADNLSQATDGLRAAAAGATNEVQQESGALGGLSGVSSNCKADIDGMLESQAQLASSMRETNTSAAAQSAQLSAAYTTIQQYANHSDLSTEAQGRLKAAVETVNQMCGTQIQVTDQANGVLSDENGTIQDVTGSLSDYVNKKLEQIRVDAQQENLTALYKQQATDIENLTKAQAEYNNALANVDQQAREYCDAMNSNGIPMTLEEAKATVESSIAHGQLAQNVETAKSALDAVNQSIDTVSTSMGAAALQADGASVGISSIAQASPVVSTAINAMGADLTDFGNDLASAGVSVQMYSSLSTTQLTDLVSQWDGTTQSIVDSINGMDVQMEDSGLGAVSSLASGMQSGTVNVEAATEIVKAAAQGDWSGVASQMQAQGMIIPDSVASGISAEGYKPSSETSIMLSAVALQLSGGDVTAAAQLLGHDIDQGLADAILGNEDSVLTNTYGLTQDTIDKAREGFDSHSPSRVFQSIGEDCDSGLANGIDGNSGSPLSSMGNLVAGIIGKTDSMPGTLQGRGSSGSSGMASGLSAGIGRVLGSAQALANNAAAGVSSTPGTMQSTGFSGGSSFASGIGSASGSARSSGSSLASAASSGASGWSAYGSGSHLGNQFASGLGSAWSAVKSYASSLVNAAKSVMGFSVPDEGPWSGAEKGGVTSGMHLAQNFAEGMRLGSADVRDAAIRLSEDASFASAGNYASNSGSKQTVINNYYTMGDVAIDASSIEEFMTMDEFFRFMRRAKAGR